MTECADCKKEMPIIEKWKDGKFLCFKCFMKRLSDDNLIEGIKVHRDDLEKFINVYCGKCYEVGKSYESRGSESLESCKTCWVDHYKNQLKKRFGERLDELVENLIKDGTTPISNKSFYQQFNI